MSIFLRKREFLLLFPLVIVTALSFVIIATNKQQKTYRSKAQEMNNNQTIVPLIPSASESAQLLNQHNADVLDLLEEYNRSDETTKQNVLPHLIKQAQERKQQMMQVLKNKHALAVYEKAFSEKILHTVPQELKEDFEERKDTIKGEIVTLISDDFKNKTSSTEVFFTDFQTQERSKLFVAHQSDFAPLSSTVIEADNVVMIHDIDNKNTHLVINEAPTVHVSSLFINTSGKQKALVFLLKPLDLDPAISLPQDFESDLNRFVKNFFLEQSDDNFDLTIRVIKELYNLDESSEILDRQFNSDFFYRFSQKYYKQLIPPLEQKDINIDEYQRLIFLILTRENTESLFGLSTLGLINNNSKSLSFIPIPLPLSLIKRETEQLLTHELGHALGLPNTSNIDCPSVFLSYNNIENCIRREYSPQDGDDVMGISFGANSFNFNAVHKTFLGWLGNNNSSRSNLLKINSKLPDGEYKLNPIEQTAVQLPLPFARKDYFLESGFQKSSSGLKIIINEKRDDHDVGNAVVLSFFNELFILNKRETFFDLINGIRIDNTSKSNINEDRDMVKATREDTVTFKISSCLREFDRVNFFSIIPRRAGNGEIVSINVFENDLFDNVSGIKPANITEVFEVGNRSNCLRVSVSPILNSNITKKGIFMKKGFPMFDDFDSGEHFVLKPLNYFFIRYNESFQTAFLTKFPTNLDTEITLRIQFDLVDFDDQWLKDVTYQLHMVPSVEQGKNDFEPFPIEIQQQPEPVDELFNHLEIKRGQGQKLELVFSSSVGNNSRRATGGKSPDFKIQWLIQDNQSHNIIPPFSQKHEGIQPKEIAPPKTFSWTVPDNLPSGEYKIIFQVDPRNTLEEFNENNNMIWRSFSVVGN